MEYTKDQIQEFVNKYAVNDNLTFPTHFEHRLDVISSKILYSLLREFKPKTCLEFGTSWGGSALVILKALVCNELPYKYIGFEKEDNLRIDTLRNITHWLTTGAANSIHFELWGDITRNLHKVPQKLDFAFIDPDWEEDIAIWTYENIIPRVKKGGLVQIHDWSVREKEGRLVYEGGGYKGIFYFIDRFERGEMPLEKLFSVWDWEEYRNSSIASSFWIKK
mgnify:FL=1